MIWKKHYLDIIGYGGGTLSLTAYCLLTNNFINGDSLVYLLMNIVAALCMVVYTFTKKAYANTILNSIWSLITVLAIIRAVVT